MAQAPLKIALVGNPNSGKSSLFNALTGLRQKVGNFPGVTVDKKVGAMRIGERTVSIIDLPGTYSLYPKSADELVTCEVLLNPASADRPQLTIIVADAANLRRNLLFASQIMDLRTPVVIALTMLDIARKKGISIDLQELERQMGVPVVAINPRKGRGMEELKKAIGPIPITSPRGRETPDVPAPYSAAASPNISLPIGGRAGEGASAPSFGGARGEAFISIPQLTGPWITELQEICGAASPYAALHVACNYTELHYLNTAQRIRISAILGENNFQKTKTQGDEILQRYQKIGAIMQQCVAEESAVKKTVFSDRLDKTLLHPLWGNLILLGVLFLLFQSIFWLADYPMSWIESGFAFLGNRLGAVMPDSWVKDLLINGLLAGLSGIAVFIPQIMILFGCITLLEDSGYMARISFLTDRLMRSVGLNGRSVMPLISGMACAVPAVMAARTIQNRKERLITIMVTPLMSCSARLPVYTILIALVIPDKSFLGVFNLHGLVLMGLYLLGFAGALIVSKVMSLFIKSKDRSFFLMELPVYRAPRWKNVGVTMLEKAKIFVRDAGKVIMVISLLLWGLSSFGPGPSSPLHPPKEGGTIHSPALPEGEGAASPSSGGGRGEASAKLEHSYAGILGHAIEPVIRPLGYDWKIGIALITSFAAREVFVGTMATLYSVGDAGDDDRTLREKMRAAKRPDGRPVYSVATGLSLVIFYVFAMQCMSTMAVVKRETRSWKWPLIQFAYMLAMAYGSALLVYQLLR